jgi:bacteriocin-like protein
MREGTFPVCDHEGTMKNTISRDTSSLRVLTNEELENVSGGAGVLLHINLLQKNPFVHLNLIYKIISTPGTHTVP